MKLKTVIKAGAILLGLLVALVVALVLAKDWLVKQLIVTSVRSQTGCPFDIQKLRVGLLDGTLSVEGLTIGNPPGFGDVPLLSLPEFYVAYDLNAARSNTLRFREVRLNLDQVNLVVDQQGRTNLAVIAERMDRVGIKQSRPLPTNVLGGMTFAGVDRLQLSLGRVGISDLRTPDAQRTIVMGITNRAFTNVVDLQPLGPLIFEVTLKTLFQMR